LALQAEEIGLGLMDALGILTFKEFTMQKRFADLFFRRESCWCDPVFGDPEGLPE
jgi:hypothetical protein